MRFRLPLPLVGLSLCACTSASNPHDTASAANTGDTGLDTTPGDTTPGDTTDAGEDSGPDDTDSGEDSGPEDTGEHGDTAAPPSDADLDGVSGDLDCDDTDATVYPGAPGDSCGDAVDTDCDGSDGCDPPTGAVSLADANAKLVGPAPLTYFGSKVVVGCDFTGDGVGDVVVGGNQLTGGYLFTGPLVGDADPTAASASLDLGMAPSGLAGGDLDGDGVDDLLIGYLPTYAGAVLLFQGPVLGALHLADAQAELVGETDFDYVGTSAGAVAVLGDLDGDGDADTAIGAWSLDGSGQDSGAVYLLREAPTGTVDLADVERIDGATVGDWAGQHLASAGDVDGDGLADAWIGAPAAEDVLGTVGAGRVYLVLGPAELATLADAEAIIVSEGDRQMLGYAVKGAAESDGDGLSDGVFGAPGWLQGHDGGAYVYLGTARGTLALSDAWVTFDPIASGEQLGRTAALGDFDGDASSDVAIGASANLGMHTPGTVYLFAGPLAGGTYSTDAATATLSGEDPGDRAADAMSAGDANGDAITDLLIGSFGNDGNTGAAYLVYGGYR